MRPGEVMLPGDLLPELLGEVRRVHYIANPGNTGDAVIARATGEVFGRLGISLDEGSDVIVLGGGGNLIPRYRNMRDVLEKMPRSGKKIIILPVTAYGCFPLMGEFEDLTLLAREGVTWHLAREAGVKSFLCHDMAFELDLEWWGGQPDRDSRELLRNFRRDSESAGGEMRNEEGNRDLSEELGNRWWTLESAAGPSREFISEINLYRRVETDRLHVGIVAACLGKEVRLFPNAYFKNEAVYGNSLVGFPNVEFVDGEYGAGK